MGAETSLLRELFFSRTSDFLDTYLVSQCNKSEKTRESYRDALSVFRRYAEQTGRPILNFRFRDCTYGLLLGYKEYLAKNLGYGPSSVNHRLAALKSYARYAYGCDPSLMQFYITVSSVPLSSVPKIRRKVLDEDAEYAPAYMARVLIRFNLKKEEELLNLLLKVSFVRKKLVRNYLIQWNHI